MSARATVPAAGSDRRTLFASGSLFGELPPEALERLVAAMKEEHHPAGSVLVMEGEPGNSLYLIASGDAEVTVKGADGGPLPLVGLKSGETFGEIALLEPGGVRTATVTATSPVTLLALPRDAVEAMLQTYPELRSTAAALAERLLTRSFMRQATPFASLGPHQLRDLLARISRRSVAAGEVVIRQGEKGDVAYLVRRGRVEAVLEGAEGERRLGTMGPGAVFGEAAVLSEAPRTATVRALEASEFLVLSRSDLLWAMEQEQGIAGAMLWLLNSRARPRQVPGVEAHHRQTAEGTRVTVLKDPRRRAYYRLSPQGWFVWQRLDGDHTMRTIALAYFEEFKSFAPAAVGAVVAGLAQAGFVNVPSMKSAAVASSALTFRQRALLAAWRFFNWQIAVEGVDHVFGAIHRAGARFLFTRAGQLALALMALAGLAAWIAAAGPALATLRAPAGAALLWTLIPGLLLAIVLHEMGHGLAVKAFGREIPRVGIGWYWFTPIAFVDTSEMWLSGRWPRVAATLAGPYANAITGGLAMLLALAIGAPDLVAVAWLFALLSFASAVVNLNPILDFDGYYILSDLLDRPSLRAQSLARVGSLLSGALSWRDAVQQHRVELLYALGSLIFAAALAAAALILYRIALADWVAGWLGAGGSIAVGVVVAVLAVITSLLGAAGDLAAGWKSRDAG